MPRCFSQSAAAMALIALAAILVTNAETSAQSDRTHDTRVRIAAGAMPQVAGQTPMAIEDGDKTDAEIYYQAIAPLIGFPALLASDFTGFLNYLGFGGLQPGDLEILDSKLLMPATPSDFDQLASKVIDPAFKTKQKLEDFAQDRVLVSRFFAPKIVNFTEKNPASPNPHVAGWRKLVRIVPVPGSAADVGNIREAYVLMNYFQADVEKNPFPERRADLDENQSVNNQIILVPKSHDPATGHSAYWLVYQKRSDRYVRGDFLTAAFDNPKQGESALKPYYVPIACAQCHGHYEISENEPKPVTKDTRFPHAKLNYLDSDQWYDMLKEFPGTKNSNFDVIFDGGRDQTTTRYADAVTVLLKLNEHIKTQNKESLRGNGDDRFIVDAVEKWIGIHKKDPRPASMFQRAIGTAPGWDPAKEDLDGELLPMLSRYCFRCHGTIRYNVFDREGLKDLGSTPSFKVGNRFMPQGRILPDEDRKRLVELLDQLCIEEPACLF